MLADLPILQGQDAAYRKAGAVEEGNPEGGATGSGSSHLLIVQSLSARTVPEEGWGGAG